MSSPPLLFSPCLLHLPSEIDTARPFNGTQLLLCHVRKQEGKKKNGTRILSIDRRLVRDCVRHCVNSGAELMASDSAAAAAACSLSAQTSKDKEGKMSGQKTSNLWIWRMKKKQVYFYFGLIVSISQPQPTTSLVQVYRKHIFTSLVCSRVIPVRI